MPDAAKIKKLYEEGVSTRTGFDSEAYSNIAMLFGEMYFVQDPTTRKFYRPRYNDGRVRLSIPLIKPIWRTEVAKITKNRPIPEVIPASPAESDRQSAKIAQRILDAELERMNYTDMLTRLWTWVSSIGCAYLHPTWNPTTNNIDVEVVPHIEVVIDPAVRNSTLDANWLIHGKVMTQESVYNIFGKEFPPDSSALSGVWQSLSSLHNGGITNPKRDGVLVLRMWQRPNKKYPKGGVWTVINNEIVEDPRNEEGESVFPYTHAELPFIDFHHVKIPGRFEGQSIIRDLWSSQKDYNHARSRAAETRALLASPKIIAPVESLDIDRMSTTPGEVITYRPVGQYRPEPMQMPNIPSWIFQTQDTALSEMQDIAGQHEVSKGQVPSSGIPASALMALQESDDTKLGPIIAGLEYGIGRFGRQILGLVQQYWVEDRIVRTWSESEHVYYAEAFKSADIQGALDVKCVPGSALPKSKAKLREDYINLWREKIIQDPKEILKRLDLPDSEGLHALLEIDTKHAVREHAKFMSQEEVIAEPWHNHMIHIIEHNNWRKTPEFEALEDDVRAAVADHVAAHEALQEQEMAKQAEQAAMLGIPLDDGGGGGLAPPAPGGMPPPM